MKKTRASTAPRGAGNTAVIGMLEKKKRRKDRGASVNLPKHPRLLEKIMGGSPLRSKGDSEGAASASDNPSGPRAIAAAPISARHALLLEFSWRATTKSSIRHKRLWTRRLLRRGPCGCCHIA